MGSWYGRRCWVAAQATFLVLLTTASAQAQFRQPRDYCPPAPCPSLDVKPLPDSTMAQPPSTQDLAAAPTLSPERGAALGGETVAVSDTGYIDGAIPLSQFRFRYDAAYDNNRPDRAEFFYAKCGCFPGAPGPRLPERNVDYQDLTGYLEVAASDRVSGFVEVPFRFLNPEDNANTSGLADMNFGFKAALVAENCQYLTFQFRTYVPTGAASHGLGTDHVTLEPGLLLYKRLSDHLSLEGEFRDFIPVGGTNFEGNVLRYGVGLGYDVYRCNNLRVTPVAELVGWTVLSGQELDGLTGQQLDAAGDTIVNAKLGGRVRFSEHSDVYVGYGRALTGAVWYKDIIRLEYRLSF